ncbi:hypothetical protein P7K49_002824 [Saguinus oedipus]|uniref:Uncharacterized protein n=1 Tax=Saguinus oedipus TaxID=9490 RepID=A0ABQ9WIF1_SAGOE|nr:hypothetical protein P7K49_002824 [Saguinus oedipus]
MNFLRRRLSDSSFVANLPNGYMTDLQRPDSSSSSPASPAMERRHPQPLVASFSSPGSSIFSSLSSAMKQAPQASSGLMEPPGPSTPVVQRPRILLVIDDAHTDCLAGDIEITVQGVSPTVETGKRCIQSRGIHGWEPEKSDSGLMDGLWGWRTGLHVHVFKGDHINQVSLWTGGGIAGYHSSPLVCPVYRLRANLGPLRKIGNLASELEKDLSSLGEIEGL